MIEDQNIIGHLFEVEKQAAELLSEAQDEYNKRIATVREESDKMFKDAYEQLIKKTEARFAEESKRLEEAKSLAFSEYCSEVESWKQDIGLLHTELDSMLFSKTGTILL